MSSDEDSAQLMAAFKTAGSRKAAPPATTQTSHLVEDSESEDTLETEEGHSRVQAPSTSRRVLCVRAEPPNRRDEFVYYEPSQEVEEILRSYPGKKMLYDVKMLDKTTKQVSAFGKGSPTEGLWSSENREDEALALWIFVYIICQMIFSLLPFST
jgi:hypothetical protein